MGLLAKEQMGSVEGKLLSRKGKSCSVSLTVFLVKVSPWSSGRGSPQRE
jgi:hypothetical protein